METGTDYFIYDIEYEDQYRWIDNGRIGTDGLMGVYTDWWHHLIDAEWRIHVSKLTIIGWNNGRSPGRYQTII